MMKKRKNQGFSLLELILAVGIFSMLVVVIAGVYIGFSKAQTEARASQKLLNDSQYALELMAREIRNNVIFDFDPSASECEDILGSAVYSNCIILQKEDRSLVAFASRNRILYHIILTCNDDYSSCSWNTSQNSYAWLLAPDVNKVEVEDLDFYIWPKVDPYDSQSNDHPRVTVKLKTRYYSDRSIEQVSHNLQTTVSSRIYRR